jgi:hypothetical protein
VSPASSPSAARSFSPTPATTATPAASSSSATACAVGTLTVVDPEITIGELSRVQYRGRPGEKPRLDGYFRVRGQTPQPGVVRPAVVAVPASGVLTWTLQPETSMRVWAVDSCGTTPSSVLQVHLALTIAATRHATRDYTFSGKLRLGSRNHGRPVTLYYRSAGSRSVRRAVAESDHGSWSVRVLFAGSGRLTLFAFSATDVVNLAGRSADRPTVIY